MFLSFFSHPAKTMGTIFSHSDHQSVSLAPLGDAETAHGFSNSLSGLRVDGKPKNAILGIDNSEEVQQISQTEQASTTPLSTVLLLGAWLCLSFGIVICNKYIISDLHFPYPATLACWHLTAATIITRAIAWTTSLLGDSRQTPLHRREFLLVIFPIGLLFSLSLLLNQLPYISLSIAFIQMLKGLGPAFTLFAAWSLKLETPDLGRCANIGLIVSGVAIATYGEMKFAYSGFIYQILGLLSDGYRIGLTRKLLSGQRRLPPLVAFYHLAPISAMVLAVVAWTTEWRSTNAEKLEMSVLLGLGWQILLGSAVLAFALNMVIMQLIGRTGPLTIPLCGEFKNILIVLSSVAFWGTVITPLQVVGYAVASFGLLWYSGGSKLRAKYMNWTTTTSRATDVPC